MITSSSKVMSKLATLLVLGGSLLVSAGFAQQTCQLLPTFGLPSLTDGSSITGYRLPEANYTESCSQLEGTLYCRNGSLGNAGNLYKYPTCIPHTWRNCTGPTGANHLEWTTLYKATEASYTQDCRQLSKQFQCIDGSFTGSNVNQYTQANCEDKKRADCVDVWTNTYYHHLDTIYGYGSSSSSTSYSCDEKKVQLTCINGLWSGGNQKQLFEECNDLKIRSCTLTGGESLADGAGKWLYSFERSPYPNSCSQLSGYVSCENGSLSYNSSTYKYNSCTNGTSGDCSFSTSDAGTINIANNSTSIFYSSPSATSCNSIQASVSCSNGSLSTNSATYKYKTCIEGMPKNCILKGLDGGLYDIVHSNTRNFTSAISSTWPKTCKDISIGIGCQNGALLGDYNTYGYPIESCSDGEPATCTLPWGATLSHKLTTVAFEKTSATYPDTCEDHAVTFECNNGTILGNTSAFKYPICINKGGLVDGIDLVLGASLYVSTDGNVPQMAQYSSPSLNITIKNQGKVSVAGTNVAKGFLSCDRIMDGNKTVNVYSSNLLASFVLNAGTAMKKSIVLKDIFTQSLGLKNIACGIKAWSDAKNKETILINNIWTGTINIVESQRFDIAMDRSIDSIKSNLDAPEIKTGAEGVNSFLMNKVMNVLVPLIIVLGILISILGFYKLLFSTDDKAIGEGVKYITFGALGIIIIMSAKFISTTLYETIFQQGDLRYGAVQGFDLAQKMYENIMFPFLKLSIYLALGVLFVILASRVVGFIFASDDDTRKKAGTIITWNSVGMIVIIAAKQIIEFIYGKQKDVVKAVNNLGEIGSGLLANKNLPILYQIINWAMGLASLVILVMVLVQAFQLLMKPDSPDAMKKIKNSLVYIFVGIVVIGTGYIITNFLIVN